MLKTWVWGFLGPKGTEIVTRMKENLDVVHWMSDQKGSASLEKFLLGDIELVNPDSEAISQFEGTLRKHFNTYCIMMARRDVPISDIHELNNEFAISFYYFYRMLKAKSVDLVIFSNIPHEGGDYVLYLVAKLLGIKTLLCYQTIFPNAFYMTTSMKNFGSFSTVPALFEHPHIEVQPGHEQALFYMDSVRKPATERPPFWSRIWDFAAFSLFRARLLFSRSWPQMKIRVANKVIQVTSRQIYDRDLASLATDPSTVRSILDSHDNVIYFPLHLQPELTTAALGGVYQDQLYAIERLRSVLGKDWVFMIKENPKQSHFQRSKLFRERLFKIDNAYLVGKQFPTYELMKKSRITATITGTAGWEAVKGGGHCVVFGQAWYSTLGNCLRFTPELGADDINRFLNSSVSQEKFAESFHNLLSKAGIGVVDGDYSVVMTNFNKEKNGESVCESLMQVINHPETKWE